MDATELDRVRHGQERWQERKQRIDAIELNFVEGRNEETADMKIGTFVIVTLK